MFSDPVKNLRALGLQEDAIVADLGAGTGFYSIAAGKMVPAGKVYAVDVQKDFLMTIKTKAREAHLANVETLWGNIEKLGGTKIADAIVDVDIASNVLFQVDDKERFIDEAKRILKPGGRLLLVDWSDSPVLAKNMLMPKEKAREIFERRGLIFDHEIDAGAHHYGMIFRKSR
ncbi:MAG: methyltransferase domain-containing protein [Patescibacteria group bacterium]